jgi:hypothetical protein
MKIVVDSPLAHARDFHLDEDRYFAYMAQQRFPAH